MNFAPDHLPSYLDEPEREGVPAEASKTAQEPLLPFVWAKDVSGVEDGANEILEDILTAGAMSVWYGESNSGKTYLVLDLAKAMAKGREWLGKRTVQSCVIYVAAEGAKTIERRIRAIRLHAGELEDDYPLGVVKTGINMCSSGADTELLAKLSLDRAKEWGVKPALIIIDTLSSAMAGGNENDSADMGALVANSNTLLELTGAHILWIHHTGKDTAKGARGHSLLRARCDTEIEIIHDESTGIRTAKVSKQRDLGSHGMELSAKLRPIDLGTNQWGNPITACIVEPTMDGAQPARHASKPLKGYAARALKIAQELAQDAQLTTETSAIPGGKRLLDVGAWRQQFQDSVPEMSATAMRSSWSRALVTLQDAGIIGCHKHIIWLW
jgi:RecA-family ATPase